MTMLNMVQCKICSKEFNYKQNVSGNARQLCNNCRSNVDNNELELEKEKSIIDSNNYLVGAPGRKDKYDMVDILIEGVIPNFENDADRFICTMETAMFIKRNGISGMEKNLKSLLFVMGNLYKTLFLQQLTFEQLHNISKSPEFGSHFLDN